MISIVIVTFNSSKVLARCLSSVAAQKLSASGSNVPAIEIVVVDNGSWDGTADMVRRDFPRIILVCNDSNRGACRARNQGIEASQGDWILTLDSDVILADGFFEGFYCLAAGLSDNVGMVQTETLSADGKAVYSRGIRLTAVRRFYDIDRGGSPEKPFSASRQLLGPCSAAAFYRRSMLAAVKDRYGYFDERFFFLVEDVDLAWRARKAGWGAVFAGDCRCFHAGNGSATGRDIRQNLSFRNRYLMMSKNDTLLTRTLVNVVMLVYELPRWLSMICFNAYARKMILGATVDKPDQNTC